MLQEDKFRIASILNNFWLVFTRLQFLETDAAQLNLSCNFEEKTDLVGTTPVLTVMSLSFWRVGVTII